jgi:hypothetical protein
MGKTDMKIRNILIMYKMLISIGYIERKEGGRGLIQNKATCKVEIINTAEYLNKNMQKSGL